MVNLIIFSKDRAFQLEALMRSLKLNCDIFHYIDILIKASNKEFQKGYAKFLEMDSALGCNISYEDEEATFSWLLDAIINNNNYLDENEEPIDDVCEHTCFMVDDIICFRKCSELKLGKDIFSLRLGGIGRHKWGDYQETKQDKDYPFSVDGHIYKTEVIKEILSKGNPINPNKFEVLGYSHRDLLPDTMASFLGQMLVSIPANRVSDTATAKFGEKYGYTAKELNDRFLNGEVMDFENMDFTNITKCHKEIKFKFKKL